MLRELEPGYMVEVDRAGRDEWNSILGIFEDASIYQTWSYGAVIGGERNLSHILLRKNGEIVAAAQARITRIPFTGIGVALVRWGPLWKLRGKKEDPGVFQQMLRALRNEYACKRRLVTRILPLLFNESRGMFNPLMEKEGFRPVSVQRAERTLLIDLRGSLAELRKGLDQKWRYNLRRAEKNSLRVVDGCGDELFGRFIGIYRQMHGRKKFVETSDVHLHRLVQRDLPDSTKMKVLLAFSDQKCAAGVICSKIGEMGVYLFGATGDAGLNTYGSYLLQWKALCWLKETGAKWYNLHGINPRVNPGTFRFKKGLCGKNGKDVHFLGTFESHENSLASKVVWLANFSRNGIRSFRGGVRSLLPNGKRTQQLGSS